MKKHYTRITIIIEVLILVTFTLGGVLFTYVTASKEMKNYMNRAGNNLTFSLPEEKYHNTEEALIKYVTFWHWGYIVDAPVTDMGFYGRLELADDIVLDTSRDYCVVSKSGNGKLEDEELRICTFDGKIFDVEKLYTPVINADCDDIFIYKGTLEYNGKTAELKDISYRDTKRIPYSEWASGEEVRCTVLVFAENKKEEKLNREAQVICEEYLAGLKSGTIPEMKKEDIWTSYCINRCATSAGFLYDIYVFHPVQIAVTSHIGTYIVLLLTLVVIEVVIALVFARLYKTRNEYEMRSNRLKRGIAHELKTPLAVTKAYMENWEYMDEEERSMYAGKINREVGDMNELINTLLEMDKIDSGKVKLNREEVELGSLIQAVYGRIKPLADERGLEVTFKTDKEYMISADLKLIRIAIGNYLTNMVKYADKKAEVEIVTNANRYRVEFRNDSTNDDKNRIDKLNSNGMGVEINENIMKLHGFKSGAEMQGKETMFWFEAEIV